MPREALVLTCAANMGVLVGWGDSKVLIDGLYDTAKSSTRVSSPKMLESLVKGEPPFKDVDLVLVTYKDQDHFSAALAGRFLETRPEPILLAPSDAVEQLRKTASDWSRIEPRVIPIDLRIGEKAKKEVAGVPLAIVRCRASLSPRERLRRQPLGREIRVHANDLEEGGNVLALAAGPTGIEVLPFLTPAQGWV